MDRSKPSGQLSDEGREKVQNLIAMHKDWFDECNQFSAMFLVGLKNDAISES